MESVEYLVVPGRARSVAQVLATCEPLCSDMREAQPACQHLHSQLMHIYDVLRRQNNVWDNGVLVKFTSIVSRFVDFLERFGGRSLILHVIKHPAIVDALRELYAMVGQVFDSNGMVATAGWEEQCQESIYVLKEVVTAMAEDGTGVLREIKGARAREEALLMLKFEVELREEYHGQEIAGLMKMMMATLGRESSPALPRWFVPLYDVEIETDPCGRGTFGLVYRGVWALGTPVIVKRVPVDSLEVDEGVQRKIASELDKVYELNHPNLVKLLGASHASSPPYLVSEDATNGNLGTFLGRSAENKRQMWILLYEAAIGLDHLHKAGIVHGNVKLNNILVGADGHAKLSDFGLSTVRAYASPSSSTSGGWRWRAPECLRIRPTCASDVYSLGVCIIATEIGELPFAFLSDDAVRKNLRRGEAVLQKPESMTTSVWELVVSMTRANPSERLSLEMVIDQLHVLARADSADLTPTQPGARSRATEEGSLSGAHYDGYDGCEGSSSPNQEASSRLDWPSAQAPRPSASKPSGNFLVGDVVSTLTKRSAEAQEETLVRLIQACLDPQQRQQLQESNGFPVLVELVKYGSTDFIRVCALGCLGWCAELDSSFPESAYEALQESIRDGNPPDYSHLADDLRHGSTNVWLKTVIYCACVAEVRGSEVLQGAGVVEPLVALLRQSDEALVLWTMNAVGNIADNDEMRSAVAREEAIPPLVKLLESGSNHQTALAAYALGCLASGHGDNNAEIARSGAIPYLVTLLTGETDMQRSFAVFALESLAEGYHPLNWLVMTNEGAIAPLIGLLRTGTSIQKSHAVSALGSLASNDGNCVRIAREGVIPDLVSLYQHGTANHRERAVGTLHFLSRSAENSKRMIKGGAIAVLVESIESGTEEQVEHAIVALGSLASHATDNGKAILQQGAVAPLKRVLLTGTEAQQGVAAFALGQLCAVSETIRLTIADDEVMKQIVRLVLTADGEQKDLAMGAMSFLTDHGNGDLQLIKSKAMVPHVIELMKKRFPHHQAFTSTVLGRFAGDDTFRALVGNKGGIPPLVKLLGAGNAANKQKAAIALGRLAVGNLRNRSEMIGLGAVKLLENLSRTGTRQQKRSANAALIDIEDEANNEARRRRVGHYKYADSY